MVTKDLKALGSSGLNQQSGYIQDDPLKDLWGIRGAQEFRKMSEDAVPSAILFAIEMLIRRVSWRVEPNPNFVDDDAAVQYAQFGDECLHDMSHDWEETLSEIITFLPYGYAPMNVVYKQRNGAKDDGSRSVHDDGLIGWRKWSLRSQDTIERWVFDEAGGVTAMVQVAPPDYRTTEIPIEALLLFRTTARKGNPEGRSILRGGYKSYLYKTHIEKIEGIGIERDLAGLPVAWVPPELLSSEASAEESTLREAIKNIVTGIRRDEQEGLVFPLSYDDNGHKEYDLTLLSTGGTRQFNTGEVINRYHQLIAMTVLADFIMLGHESVGSFALASSKTNLFSYALGSFLDMIAGVINRHGFTRLMLANGWPAEKAPVLTHGDIESVDLTELAAYVTALTGANIIFDDKAVEHLLDQAQIPHDKVAADDGTV